MFVVPLPRPTKVVKISASANNVDLFTQASSPAYPLSVFCFVDANVASSNSSAAFNTGTSWKSGSWLYIKNNAVIAGATGNTGATGATGSTGNTGASGTAGSTGAPGAAGNAGASGSTGAGGAGGTGGANFYNGTYYDGARTVEGTVYQIAANAGSAGSVGGTGGTGEAGNAGSAGGPGGAGNAGSPGAPGGTGGTGGTGGDGSYTPIEEPPADEPEQLSGPT